MNSNLTYPFILVGPSGCEKTDFLLACALAHAAQNLENLNSDKKNALILCSSFMVAEQIRLCIEKAFPETGGLGINCMTYNQLMRESGFRGPPWVGVPPAFLRNSENRNELKNILSSRFSLVLFDQMFEAIRFFPELIEIIPDQIQWAGALSSTTEKETYFETAIAVLKEVIPDLKIEQYKTPSRRKASRQFFHYQDLSKSMEKLEEWMSLPLSDKEGTLRAWPRVIILHRSLWTKRKKIAMDVTKFLCDEGFKAVNGVFYATPFVDAIPEVILVTEFEARGLASKHSLVLHNRPSKSVNTEFENENEQLEGGQYNPDQWNIQPLTSYELSLWTEEEARLKILIFKGQRVFLLNYYTDNNPENWMVEIKIGTNVVQAKVVDLYFAEPKDQ